MVDVAGLETGVEVQFYNLDVLADTGNLVERAAVEQAEAGAEPEAAAAPGKEKEKEGGKS